MDHEYEYVFSLIPTHNQLIINFAEFFVLLWVDRILATFQDSRRLTPTQDNMFFFIGFAMKALLFSNRFHRFRYDINTVPMVFKDYDTSENYNNAPKLRNVISSMWHLYRTEGCKHELELCNIRTMCSRIRIEKCKIINTWSIELWSSMRPSLVSAVLFK